MTKWKKSDPTWECANMIKLRDKEMSASERHSYYMSSSLEDIMADEAFGPAESYCNNAIMTTLSFVLTTYFYITIL